MTISNEAISAARKAVENAMRQRTYDRHAHDEEVFHEGVDDITTAALSAAAPILRAEALREAADLAEDTIAYGDVAECAAYVEGEVGRQSAVDARDSLYEEPAAWLRARADQIDGGNK